MSSDQAVQAQEVSLNITVNGRPRVVHKSRLTYAEVVELAFPNTVPNPDILYTIDYANPHGQDGALAEGGVVDVKVGMSFNVSKTNRS